MKNTLLLLSLLLVSAPGQAQENGKLFNALGYAVHVVSAGEAVTTEVGLANGAYEANPLMRSDYVRYPVYAVRPFGVNAATEKLYREGHRKTALWMRIAFVAGYGYVIAHNLRQ